MSDPAACFVGKPRKPDLETRLYQALGQFDGYYTRPPGDALRVQLDADYLARTSNDGFELWIGTENEWSWHCRAAEARKLAWFILWTYWVKGTWFGLRRWAWYKLLTRQCNRTRKAGKAIRDAEASK